MEGEVDGTIPSYVIMPGKPVNIRAHMLDITNTAVYGLIDSALYSGLPHDCTATPWERTEDIGHALERASRLANTPMGSGHDNFLVGIVVQFTVTAPRYWWPQLQRYHHVDIVSSTSTMHTLRKVLEKSRRKRVCDIVEMLADRFTPETPDMVLESFASMLKAHPEMLVEGDTGMLKQCLPESWLQTARLSTNYRQLRTIYAQRKSHPLEEWRQFCDWIRTLEMSAELITGEAKKTGEASQASPAVN